jgi:hypothetical protein
MRWFASRQKSQHRRAGDLATVRTDNSLPAIISDDSRLSDHRNIDFLLESIFREKEFARLRIVAANYLRELRPRLSEVASALDVFLASSKSNLRGELVRNAVAELARHRVQTEFSRDAYSAARPESANSMFWPNPTLPAPHGRPLWGEPPFAQKLALIDRKTKIGSAGSCFAIEIKKHLREQGYNYVETEPNEFASANWGMHYNALAFLQTVEWAFGLRERPSVAFPSSDSGEHKFWDPFR